MDELLEWPLLTEDRKAAVKLISEQSFLGFQRIFFQLIRGEKWSVNWHHRYLARCVEEMVSGERSNTIFNIPPGSGKTETFSIHAPVWSIIKTKKIRNLNISFSNTLAKRNSRWSRDIINSDPYQELWPCEFGVNQAEEWQLVDFNDRVFAEVVSRPIQGQIMGGRGGFPGKTFSGWIMLDDIDKPLDMFSQVKRESSHQTLVNTIRSRRGDKSKEHPTPIGSIQQRLHVNDSTWFLLSGGMGLEFDLIKIPALIDEAYINGLPEWIRDECWKCVKDSEQVNGYWSFWPENEYIGDLMSLWDKSPYTFMSQYMQAPIKIGGEIFDPAWWQYWGDLEGSEPRPPLFEYRFITADTAQKTNNWNDYSVFAEWGIYQKKLYLLNLVRDKWQAPQLRAQFLRFLSQAWGRNCRENGNLRGAWVEDKSSGTGLIQEVAQKSPCKIHPIPRHVDKYTRALDAAPQVELGKVYLPDDKGFVTEFVSEHAAFTGEDGVGHDDQVDVTMDAINLSIIQAGRPNRAADYYNSRKK